MAKTTLEATDFLAKPEKHDIPAVVAVYGDEAFLKRQVLLAFKKTVVSGEDAEFSIVTLDGDDAALEFRHVADELSTGSLFGDGDRLVIVEEADSFVSKCRSQLEDYVAKPRSSATLVLEVNTWPSNTRLAKAVLELGLSIECKTPSPAKLSKFLIHWAQQRHAIKLEAAAADTLLELLEPEVGILDQELARLANLVAPGEPITDKVIREHVGSWRVREVWDLIDAAANGNAEEALSQLDVLILSGEAPVAMLGQIASSLRRFAAATRLVVDAQNAGRRIQLRDALVDAGIKPFVLGKVEPQLKQIGSARGGQLLRWLLEADLAIKGIHSAPHRARMVLEQLMARLSAKSRPVASSTS
jgi:DNA polymerase-3 subunit delta